MQSADHHHHQRAARIRAAFIAVLLAALAGAFAPRAAAQENAGRFEVGGDYNYVRTNAPPGGCGCINLNGGDGWVSYNLTRSWAVVGQIGAQHASNIGGTNGADLTFTSYCLEGGSVTASATACCHSRKCCSAERMPAAHSRHKIQVWADQETRLRLPLAPDWILA